MERITIKHIVGGTLEVLTSSYQDVLVPDRGTITLKIVNGKIEGDLSPSKAHTVARTAKSFKVGKGWVSKIVATMKQGDEKNFDPKSPAEFDPNMKFGEYLLLRSLDKALVYNITNNDEEGGNYAFWLKVKPQDFPLKGATQQLDAGAIKMKTNQYQDLDVDQQIVVHYF